jgi:hypothetical protein
VPEDVTTAPYRDVREPLGGYRYSLRGRYDTDPDDTPGPGYVPPPFGRDAQKSHIASRYPGESPADTPGPGRYLPERPLGADAPSATMHGPKDRGAAAADRSPGPAEYSTAGAAGANTPRFTLKGARVEPKRDPTGEYHDLGSTLAKPKTTLHGRPALDAAFG